MSFSNANSLWRFNTSVLAESSTLAPPSSHTKLPLATGSDLKKENPLRKSAITGCAVVVEMLSGGLFMENAKMEKQRTSDAYPRIVRRVLRQGLRGVWAGFYPWGFTLGMTKGMVLGGSRAFFLNGLLNAGLSQAQADVGSGFMAGAIQGVFMAPIMLARTRVNQHLTERATNAGSGKIKSGMAEEMRISMQILNRDIAQYGFGSLLTGMPTMVFKRSMDWGSRFVLMRYVRNYFHSRKEDPSQKLTTLEQLASSIVGGGLSVFICMPVDRLMPILQAANRSKDATVKSIIRERVAAEGFGTLQRGFVMRLLHCSWHTTFAIFISGRIYTAIDERL